MPGIRFFCLFCFILIHLPGFSQESNPADPAAWVDSLLLKAEKHYEASRYDSLEYFYGSALAVARDHMLWDRQAGCLLGLAEAFRLAGNYGSCLAYLESAGELLEQHPEPGQAHQAALLYIQGKATYGLGKVQESVGIFRQAVNAWQRSGSDARGLARTLNFLGNAWYRLGDLDSAGHYYREFGRLVGAIEPQPAIESAWYCSNMAMLHRRKGDYRRANDLARQSIQITKQISGYDNPQLARTYHDQASNYMLTGEFSLVEDYLDSAELYLDQYFPDNSERHARLYVMRGNLSYRQGNYINALHHYERAWNLLSGTFPPDHYLILSLYINLGNAAYVLGEYRKALEYYTRYYEQRENLHPESILNAYHYLARTNQQLGRTKSAEGFYRRSIRDRIKHYGDTVPELLHDYLAYGNFLIDSDRLEEGHKYLNRALDVSLRVYGAGHYQTAEVWINLGEFCERTAEPDSALYYYDSAIEALTGAGGEAYSWQSDSGEVSNYLIYLRALKGKAEALQKMQGRRTGALDCYELIFPVIDRMRQNSMTEEGRIFISDNERDTYDQAVKLAMNLYLDSGSEEYLERAYLIAEKAKYSALLMAVRSNHAISFSRVPDTLRTALNDLQTQINTYRELVRQAGRSSDEAGRSSDDAGRSGDEAGRSGDEAGRLQQFRKELYALQEREVRLIRELESSYPEYYRLKYNTEVTTAKTITNHLRRHDRLIDYYLTGSEVITFVFTRKDKQGWMQEIDSSFRQQIDQVRFFCSRDFNTDSTGQTDDFISCATELHELLITPCGLQDDERLIIIPDGIMNYLPFDVLLTSQDITSLQFRHFPWLARDHPILYAYSATLYVESMNARRSSAGSPLAMAPGYQMNMRGGDAAASREMEIDRSRLVPLRGSLAEIRGIQSLVGGEAISGGASSEYQFKKRAASSRIIHLAMHAYMDDADPLYSKLVFADNQEGGEDGFLNTYEIYELNLAARMVVLSACHTGTGMVRRGEGIMSLARAFYYSGTPNVVMSQWAVGDSSGSRLMIGFYQQLKNGFSKDRALQRAKMQYLQQARPVEQRPYFWAGYMVTGNPEPLYFSWKRWVYLPVAMLLIAMILIKVTGVLILPWRNNSRFP